jgi:hypothetical protein
LGFGKLKGNMLNFHHKNCEAHYLEFEEARDCWFLLIELLTISAELSEAGKKKFQVIINQCGIILI